MVFTCSDCGRKYRGWDLQEPLPVGIEKGEAENLSKTHCVPCSDPKFSSLEHTKDWINRTGCKIAPNNFAEEDDIRNYETLSRVGGKRCYACINFRDIPFVVCKVNINLNLTGPCAKCQRIRPWVLTRHFVYEKKIYNEHLAINHEISVNRQFLDLYETTPFTCDEDHIYFHSGNIRFAFPRDFCVRILLCFPPPKKNLIK